MKVAFVGVPCDIQALRKIEALSTQEWKDSIELQVGLFCRENWAYTCFRALIEDDYGVKLENVEKFDIKKGNIIAFLRDGNKLEIPLKKSRPYVRIGCQVCLDFTAELADISVGAVGTPLKWSTVVVRTKKGEEVVEGAIREGYIEAMPIEKVKPGIPLIRRISDEKKEENLAEANARHKRGITPLHIKTIGEKDLEKLRKDAIGKDFRALERDVIDVGACIACGACEAVCPDNCVKVIDQRPRLQKSCEKEECNDCYLLCPRTFLPLLALEDRIFSNGAQLVKGVGKCLKIYAARAKDPEILEKGQDGGAVTAILAYALDKGVVDQVVSATKGGDPWKPKPKISSSIEELKETSGTIYSHSISIPTLRYG
jgi:coenzyme F420 hydrogenase subunit beta